MARAKSKLIQGYFKTPVTEAGRIGNIVALYPYRYKMSSYDRYRGTSYEASYRGVHRVLDPCAGTGEAAALVAHRGAMTGLRELDSMAKPAKALTYGVEINKERAAQARRSLNRVIEGDLAIAEISKEMASVLYLNPPYDDDAEFRRLEHSFLVRTTPYLKVAGLLALIIPRRRLEVSADYLARNYEDFKFWTFDEKEYPVFKQIVLLAKKRHLQLDYEDEIEEAKYQLVEWAQGNDLVEPPEDRVVVMAAEEKDDGKASVTFAKRRFNVDAALKEVQDNGITASEAYRDDGLAGRRRGRGPAADGAEEVPPDSPADGRGDGPRPDTRGQDLRADQGVVQEGDRRGGRADGRRGRTREAHLHGEVGGHLRGPRHDNLGVHPVRMRE